MLQNKHVSIQPATSYTMTNLVPNTVYTVRLSARSARGEGVSTHPVQIRTIEFGKENTLHYSPNSVQILSLLIFEGVKVSGE